MKAKLLCPVVLGLVMVACGGGSSTENDAGTQQPGADGGQPAALTVAVSPSNGTKGVLKATPLVLAFSRVMNTQSVEAAWSSTSLPKAQLKFVWNEAKTILVVDASAVLQYPAGSETVDSMGYEIIVEADAQAADGEALGTKLVSSFDTARDVTMQLPRVVAATGSHNGSASGADIRIGDTASNGTWRGFITADLSGLPPVVEVVSASLFARQTSVQGAPYGDLGNVRLVHLAPIAALDAAAYSTAGAFVSDFSSSAAVANPGGDRTADVKAKVKSDLAEGRVSSSYRLEFTNAHDNGSDEDYAIFDPTSVKLTINVLAK